MKVHRLAILSAFALTVTLLAACGTASASGIGTYSANGKAFELKSGYAFPYLRAGTPVTLMMLCDVAKIDAAALNAVEDRFHAFYDQLRKSYENRNCLEIYVTPEGKLDAFDANTMTGSRGVAGESRGPDQYKLELQHNDAKRIEGRLRNTETMKKEHGLEFDLHFALDVAPPPPAAK